MNDADKAKVYDKIKDYLFKNGWKVDDVTYGSPIDGFNGESFIHPEIENGSHSLMSAFRIECYKDAPKQGDRLRKHLSQLEILILTNDNSTEIVKLPANGAELNPVTLIDLPDNPTIHLPDEESSTKRKEAFVEWMTRGSPYSSHKNKKE